MANPTQKFMENFVNGISECEACALLEIISARLRKSAIERAMREGSLKGAKLGGRGRKKQEEAK